MRLPYVLPMESSAAAARRALDCDPRSVEALTALATQAALFERRPDRAEAGFGEAQALGGGVRAFRGLALLLSARGRHDEAAAAMARARAVEPISTLVDIGDALCAFNAGRFSAYPLPGRTYLLKAGATF